MRIAMIGHKRYGSREGGVEVVVTELARRMAALGHEVTCYDRSGTDVMTGDAADGRERTVDGVRVVPVKTIDKKGLAALSSSCFATLAAIKDRPDVIHYHAEGPCVPLPWRSVPASGPSPPSTAWTGSAPSGAGSPAHTSRWGRGPPLPRQTV